MLIDLTSTYVVALGMGSRDQDELKERELASSVPLIRSVWKLENTPVACHAQFIIMCRFFTRVMRALRFS